MTWWHHEERTTLQVNMSYGMTPYKHYTEFPTPIDDKGKTIDLLHMKFATKCVGEAGSPWKFGKPIKFYSCKDLW
jgi:hypothetical protein